MRQIHIKTQFEWFHKYKGAPKEVEFLRNLHRHLFYVGVGIEVRGENRELEFFIVQRKVRKFIELYKKDSKQTESCETIAEYILDWMETEYPNRRIEVSISEDNENTSIVNNYENYK